MRSTVVLTVAGTLAAALARKLAEADIEVQQAVIAGTGANYKQSIYELSKIDMVDISPVAYQPEPQPRHYSDFHCHKKLPRKMQGMAAKACR